MARAFDDVKLHSSKRTDSIVTLGQIVSMSFNAKSRKTFILDVRPEISLKLCKLYTSWDQF